MRRFGLSFILFCAVCLISCEGTSFQSSVPTYPVRVSIDTKVGAFVHFQETSLGEYVVANKDGYFLNGDYVLPFPVTDACGYGGVLVYVDLFGYAAYDLACPYCASRGLKQPCEINGAFAVCPNCHEEYDVASGTAAPQKGMIKETLRRLNIINSDGKLTITQTQ